MTTSIPSKITEFLASEDGASFFAGTIPTEAGRRIIVRSRTEFGGEKLRAGDEITVDAELNLVSIDRIS